MLDVTCKHCLGRFRAKKSMKGGIVNCPECGKATEVPGGPEPLFWLLFSVGVSAGLAFTFAAWTIYGSAAGLSVLTICTAVVIVAVVAS